VKRTIVNLRYLALIALLGCSLAAPALAADIYVISHPGVSIAVEDVREIFLGEKQFAGPHKIVPVDNLAAQGGFLSKVLHMDAASYYSAWAKKTFRDGIAPPILRSGGDADVIRFVKGMPGAIGYVAVRPGDDVAIVAKY